MLKWGGLRAGRWLSFGMPTRTLLRQGYEGLAVGVAGGWVIFWWVEFGGLGFVWLRS